MLLDRLVERPGDLSFWKTKLKDEESYVIQILPKKESFRVYSVSLPLFLFSLATDCAMVDCSMNKSVQYSCKVHQ